GVHFGHQTRRWNPKMKRFIFGEKNGIYIVDLEKTAEGVKQAQEFLRAAAAQGGAILFVGTKKQAQPIIAEEATRCGQFYVNLRWLGGLLTNFQTIRKSIERLKTIRAWREDGTLSRLTKKEAFHQEKELAKLEKVLSGIIEMERIPRAVVIVDAKREETAVMEAGRLRVPVVALVDTNSDPDPISYVIPGNDDAIRSIRLILSLLADAILEGRQAYLAGKAKEEEERARAAAPPEPAPAPVAAPAPPSVSEPAAAPPPPPKAEQAAEPAPAPEVPAVIDEVEAVVPEKVLKVEETAAPKKKRVPKAKAGPKAAEPGSPVE
ncbi:MAG: 30S ribosomal protein S2, partial [Candidatus Omnitrophica bacterium]|nr:30S ribosomal protein S2 [Candidatus Omnitrophota bacterium]